MGKSLFALKKYAESAQILQPLYEASQNREAGKVLALDFYYLEKWPEAVAYLEKLLQEGTELSLLNLAAECYLKLDLPAKALLMIEKSLKLEPNQPQARKLEEIIKARLK
jgi:tetratricopeptide (TPR) repeat protein